MLDVSITFPLTNNLDLGMVLIEKSFVTGNLSIYFMPIIKVEQLTFNDVSLSLNIVKEFNRITGVIVLA